MAYDSSDVNEWMLDIVDNMKHLFGKLTFLHVRNPHKLYLQDNKRGEAIYNSLRARYPESENPKVAIQLKEMGEKNTNMIILENYVASSSSILFLGYAVLNIDSWVAKDSSLDPKTSALAFVNSYTSLSSTLPSLKNQRRTWERYCFYSMDHRSALRGSTLLWLFARGSPRSSQSSIPLMRI